MEDISLNIKKEEPLSKTMTMSVSSVIGKDGVRKVYVLFMDGKRMAELTAPDGNVLTNDGYTPDEIDRLKEYVIKEQEYIFSIAKNVSPMKAFMGMKQG